MRSLIALLALPSPNSPIAQLRVRALRRRPSRRARGRRGRLAVSGSPASWKVSSAERPSRESCPALAGSSGDLIAAIAGTRSSRAIRSVTAARSWARSRVPLRLWISTCSPARCARELLHERALGLPRVADAVVLVAHVHHAGRGADGERDEHEGQPAEDRGPAMRGAPPGRARGEAVVAHSATVRRRRGGTSVIGPCGGCADTLARCGVLPFTARDGHPWVLLHGFIDRWRTWDLVIPELEKHHDVLAPALVGHAGGAAAGGREVTARPPPRRDRAGDGRRGIETAHIVGNSLGGYFALHLAARGRARSVVALAPAGGWAKGDVSYTRDAPLLPRAAAAGQGDRAPRRRATCRRRRASAARRSSRPSTTSTSRPSCSPTRRAPVAECEGTSCR